ncbi:unnamed protein product [Moneuplotes crassus]|uniref:Uncharacterized protein n=1 Tax=Euplotes crassus TaxID=5936 RepID=A0AAD1XCY8_EUPCR|nr:unnamed protein product [Moneuplotes crassus]
MDFEFGKNNSLRERYLLNKRSSVNKFEIHSAMNNVKQLSMIIVKFYSQFRGSSATFNYSAIKMQPKAYIQETAIKTIQPVPETVNKDQSFENTSNSSLLRVKKQNSNTNSNEHRNMLDSFEDGEKLEETKDEPKDLNIPKISIKIT